MQENLKIISPVEDGSEADRFLYSAIPILETVAGNSEVKFGISKAGEGSYFDAEGRVISIEFDPENSDSQKFWIGAHEVGHFADLLQDPDSYIGNFIHNRDWSKKIAPYFIDKLNNKGLDTSSFRQRVGEDRNGESVSRMEYLIESALHEMYNSVDDIAVNRRIPQKLTMFAKDGSRGSDAKDLYEKRLFPDTDYSEFPKHRQLVYALILGHMTDREHVFSSDVVAVLNGYLDIYAKAAGVTIYDEFSYLTSPSGKGRDNLKHRIEEARRSLEPVFLKLLEEDIMKLAEEEQKQQGEDEGEGGGDEESANSSLTDPWGKPLGEIVTQRHLPMEEMEKVREFVEKQRKEQAEQVARDSMSPEEKADEAQRKSDGKIEAQYDLPPTSAEEYRRLEKIVSPYKRELAEVFNEFMKAIDQKSKLFYIKYNRSGKFNIDSYISKYGVDIASGNEQIIPWEALDVYDKRDFISRMTLFPSDISVRLVLDTSNSMDPQRIEAVSQVAVLLMEALGTFEDSVNLRFRMKNPFRVNTEIRAFGSDSEVVKKFGNKFDGDKELADRFLSITNIKESRGGTFDSIPLREINNSIDSQRQKELKLGEATDIVFLITDGGSQTGEESKILIGELLRKNVQVRGLQIGNPNSLEIEIFNEIWGEYGVGVESLGELAPKIVFLFKEFIEQLQTKVSFYEAEEDGDEDFE